MSPLNNDSDGEGDFVQSGITIYTAERGKVRNINLIMRQMHI